MQNQHQRPLLLAAITIAAAWLLAWGGYALASNSKMTVAKLRAYSQSVDLSRLSGKARTSAINALATKVIALPTDERHRARMEGAWQNWFEQMTEEERSAFIESTLPTGFKQMLAMFEKLSENQRRKIIGEALKRIKESRERMADSEETLPESAAKRGPIVTLDMEKRVKEIGLEGFYRESSAETKAMLAPMLEELQHLMKGGAFRRGDPK